MKILYLSIAGFLFTHLSFGACQEDGFENTQDEVGEKGLYNPVLACDNFCAYQHSPSGDVYVQTSGTRLGFGYKLKVKKTKARISQFKTTWGIDYVRDKITIDLETGKASQKGMRVGYISLVYGRKFFQKWEEEFRNCTNDL